MLSLYGLGRVNDLQDDRELGHRWFGPLRKTHRQGTSCAGDILWGFHSGQILGFYKDYS